MLVFMAIQRAQKIWSCQFTGRDEVAHGPDELPRQLVLATVRDDPGSWHFSKFSSSGSIDTVIQIKLECLDESMTVSVPILSGD